MSVGGRGNHAGAGVAPLNLYVSNKKHHEGAVYEMEVINFGVIRLNQLFMEMPPIKRDCPGFLNCIIAYQLVRGLCPHSPEDFEYLKIFD